MKFLVLGAGGMAGHVIALYLRERGNSVSTLSARNPLDSQTILMDINDRERLIKVLDAGDYDVIVNCIGLLVRQSEENKDKAVYINSYFPHLLETHFKDTKTKLIHLSTDCVFSGKNPPYKEDSPYDGELFYDRSKALGELINAKDLTFRMSIIGPDMHPEGIGLFNWFIQQEGEINGYTKAIWNGVTTIELARAITEAIDQDLTGLYHLVPAASISKYDLLQLFKSTFQRADISIRAVDGVTLDKTLVNTRNDFNYQVNDYPAMIKTMKEWILAHPTLYRHYE